MRTPAMMIAPVVNKVFPRAITCSTAPPPDIAAIKPISKHPTPNTADIERGTFIIYITTQGQLFAYGLQHLEKKPNYLLTPTPFIINRILSFIILFTFVVSKRTLFETNLVNLVLSLVLLYFCKFKTDSIYPNTRTRAFLRLFLITRKNIPNTQFRPAPLSLLILLLV